MKTWTTTIEHAFRTLIARLPWRANAARSEAKQQREGVARWEDEGGSPPAPGLDQPPTQP